MSKIPDINLPVWMNKGEPLTLAHASKVWWERVYAWLTFPLAQIDVDTCDEQLLTLLAYQRDIDRFPGESLALFRLRVKYAFVNAKDAGSKVGFARIFERLEIGQIQQLERQLWLDWDVILLRINDEQLSRNNALMMNLVRQYGRTCRRYFFDVLNQRALSVRAGQFDLNAGYHDALYVPTFEIVGFHINDWVTSSFSPTCSFEGATYTVIVQGGVGTTQFVIAEGDAIAMTDGTIIIHGSGDIAVSISDDLGRTLEHRISPTRYFVPTPADTVLSQYEMPVFIMQVGGRFGHIDEFIPWPQLPSHTLVREMGSLWGEWGNMTAYGWRQYWISGQPGDSVWITDTEDGIGGTYYVGAFLNTGKPRSTSTQDPNKYSVAAVLDLTEPLALNGCDVNGWYYEQFSPTTSFAGARYRLHAIGHGGKPITWKVTGPATITTEGWVTITGPGAVSITGTNYRGETITHTINPKKYFIPSPAPMRAAEFDTFITSTGGVQASNRDLTIGTGHRGREALWSEWGNMAVYGWPVYYTPTVATYWNAKPTEESQDNAVFLNDGNSRRMIGVSETFSWYVAAVINS
ncbi:phage tail protein [Serratia fonticola]|uniref:phage tail protein n=1 Tax=Serratia fonticola TaxID=47917 RepID=UPI003BB50A4C